MSRLEDVYKVEVATCFDELAAAKARLARWTAELRSYGVTLSFQFTFPPKSSCSAKLTAVEKAANDARKEVGVRSCRKLRRGPTGGYCLRKDKPNRGGNDCLSPQLAAALASHAFVGTSVTVLDLGAGIGQYGTFFRSHAAASHINYIALDGAENIEESTKGLVRFADLTDGLPRDVRALPRVHWAMSLEVAEHVPRSGEPRFLHALTSIPTDGVILSWATPGQAGGGGGARHVNCQWASYVNCALGILGYEYDATLVDQLGKQKRNSTFPCHWLRFNIMAFRRRVTKNVAHQRLRAQDVQRLRDLLGGPVSSPEFESLYLNVTATRCEHADGLRACGCIRNRTANPPLICPTCTEHGPLTARRGKSCAACDECARLHKPRWHERWYE